MPLAWLFFASGCVSPQVEDTIEAVPKGGVTFISMDRGESPSAPSAVFYKIYINDELATKTESGGSFEKKRAELKLPPGVYLVFSERWELQGASSGATSGATAGTEKKFIRANNIKQMKEPLELVIGEKGAKVEIYFGFDYSERSFYIETEK